MTGWHVFFSKDLRQSSAIAAAHAAKVELDADTLEPEQAIALGDVSPSGAQFKGQLARQLASRFGAEFAKAAESLTEGQWSDPIETPFGAHLLLVQERTEPQTPPLSEIRARVAAVYKSSQREERLASAMKALRARYEVVVE
jgi:peptidyl-prolyl cis-trans isomerase C